ncbi:ATP-binding protein [Paenarthrobacter aurescens]|uniref:ATP-binding protein n=1 Tax=Paenarthrobacter aurescens TaxID=43663 RepID=UPI00366F6D16
MGASRLVTLVGTGGVGKTRLALHVGATVNQSFDDGVWFVDFASLTDSALVPEAIVSALGIRTNSAERAVAQLTSYLAERQLLLLLDNCEHVLDGCRGLIERLLAGSSRLSVLATSREPFGIKGEQVMPVLPFDLPQQGEVLEDSALRRFDSLAFLYDRAKANSPDFRITNENVGAAAELCIQLDGIPLALELAAARLRSLTVRQLLERTRSRFALLTSGSPTAPARQQTLRALIDWSHDLCSAEEKLLWRRMSVFAGSADLEAIEDVCSDEGLPRSSILAVIDSLVSKSILISLVTPGTVRYRVLETIREYAQERAEEAGEEAGLRERHAKFYGEVARTCARDFWSPRQDSWIRLLRLEHENMRAALTNLIAWKEVLALQLVADLRFHWMVGGLVSEGRRWLHLALRTCGDRGISRARALCVGAWAASVQGDTAEMRHLLEECRLLTMNLRGSDQISEADADDLETQIQTWTGSLLFVGGDPHGAAALFERALDRSRAEGRVEGMMLVLFQLSVTYALMSDFEKAEAVSAEAMELSARVGDTYVKSVTLWSKAYCAWAQGDPGRALQYAHQSLNRSLILDDKLVSALNLEVVSGALASLSKYEDAAVVRGIAARLWEALESSLTSLSRNLASAHEKAAERTAKALGPRLHREAMARGYKMIQDEVTTHLLGLEDSASRATQARGGAETLTKRQLQVAQLITEGKSNREIANSLFLSSRTVEGHVESILAKLGLTSRTQIASWMNKRSIPGS